MYIKTIYMWCINRFFFVKQFHLPNNNIKNILHINCDGYFLEKFLINYLRDDGTVKVFKYYYRRESNK